MIVSSAFRGYRLAAAVVAAVLFASAGAAHAAIADCLDAVCRITVADGSCGTGCVFEISRDQVYVLTAAHVVGEAASVNCEFWREGHQSRPLAAQVLGRSKEADAAILAVPVAVFGDALPTAIPLAPRDCQIQPGETLTSAGCAGGAWSTGWKGHALGYDGDDLQFVPPPANGRSGSAVFDARGRQIVGIVRARTGDNSLGIATSIQAVYRAFDVASPAAPPQGRLPAQGGGPRDEEQTQCGPGGCPYSPQGPQGPQYHLLPNRLRRDSEPKPLYPTLPPAVDVKPLDEKLGRIAEMLSEIRLERHPPAPGALPADKSVPPEAAADPQARKAAADALQNSAQALEAAKAAQAESAKVTEIAGGLASQMKEIAGQTNRLSAAQEKAEEAIQKHGTLAERIDLLKQRVEEKVGEDASRPEKIRAFIHEAVTDKTEWLRMGLVLAMALPLLIFVIDYAHHKKSGDPLLIERLATQLTAAATQQPMLQPAANLASHAATDVTGLLALLAQQAQAQRPAAAPATVVVTPAQAAATPAATAAPVAQVAAPAVAAPVAKT